MFLDQTDKKDFQNESKLAERDPLDLSNMFFSRLPSISSDSTFHSGGGLFEEEPSIEDLFQQNREWLAPEEDQPITILQEEPSDPEEEDEPTFEIFAKSNFYEEGDKLSELALNYDSLAECSPLFKEEQPLKDEQEDPQLLSEDTLCTPKIQENKPRKKVGRKKIETGMEQRKDVVLKKVLRKIRNHYWKDFQNCTKFPIKKRGKADDHFLKECLNIYIRKVFQQEPKPGMVRTLCNLMCGKDNKQKENLIYQTLYKFSFTRFKKVTRNSNFRYLVQRYSDEVEIDTLTSDESIGLQMILSVTTKS